eukprot:8764917-Pyramimonas_sp.AAC.1
MVAQFQAVAFVRVTGTFVLKAFYWYTDGEQFLLKTEFTFDTSLAITNKYVILESGATSTRMEGDSFSTRCCRSRCL